jgi:formylglycine-generating enzyme required for sulfatase activity
VTIGHRAACIIGSIVPSTLASLNDVRSALALSVLAYLEQEVLDVDQLPAYFPRRLQVGGFLRLRQRVRVIRRGSVDDLGQEAPPPSGTDYRPRQAPEGAGPGTRDWDTAYADGLRRSVVVGDPGGGKSWLLRWYVRQLAQKALDAVRDRRVRLDQIELPVLVRLRDVASELDGRRSLVEVLKQHVQKRADTAAARGLGGTSRSHLLAVARTFNDWVDRCFETGRVCLLLDGWDEVSDDQRAIVARAIGRRGAGQVGGPDPLLVRYGQVRLCLTTRGAAFDPRTVPLPPGEPYDELQLLAFDHAARDAFMAAWFTPPTAEQLARVGFDPNEVEKVLDEIKRALPARHEALTAALGASHALAELVRNPLMLTLACRLAEEAPDPATLPNTRVEFYDGCVRGLLGDWPEPDKGAPPSDPGQVQERLDVLAPVAKQMFAAGKVWAGRPLIDKLIATVRKDLPDGHSLKTPGVAAGRIGGIRQSFEAAGLLVPTGLDRDADLEFLHRTFQEHLAAVALATPSLNVATESTSIGVAATRLADDLAPHVSDAGWREVVLLAVGYAGLGPWEPLGGQRSDLAGAAVEQVIAREREPGDALAVMGRAVVEVGARGVGQTCFERVRAQLLGALSGEGAALAAPATGATTRAPRFPATRRAAFGDVLAQAPDPRFHGPDHWGLPNDIVCGASKDLLGFVRVPAGPFRMGSDTSSDGDTFEHETPQGPVTLGEYYIARWPVTVAQFQLFVKATARKQELPPHWASAQGPANHPVVSVNWHDGQAYAKWLTRQMREAAKLNLPDPLLKLFGEPEPWRVRLASEAEWEKAARGGDGPIYPWGDGANPERANYDATGIGGTSAVGCFPRGGRKMATGDPLGVEELAGNVFEWTRSKYGFDFRYPYVPTDGREDESGTERRVLRGGSFSSLRRSVRAASRYHGAPDPRYGYGCRVVLSPFAFDL